MAEVISQTLRDLLLVGLEIGLLFGLSRNPRRHRKGLDRNVRSPIESIMKKWLTLQGEPLFCNH